MTGWHSLRQKGLGLRAQHFTAFENPRAAQAALLREILSAMAGSRFARDHGLDTEMSFESFRAAVPIRNYNDFSPWMSQLIGGDGTALSACPPLALELTGGSSGGRKPVPMTPMLLDGFRRGLVAWLGDLSTTWPAICEGKTYFALSPALSKAPAPMGSLPIGLASDLAYLGEEIAPLLAPSLLHTTEITRLRDPGTWQLATLAMMLNAQDLSFISVWSPSFLTALLRVLKSDIEPVLKLLHDGGFGIPPNPQRARELRKLGSFSAEKFWPKLALVSAWSDASAAPQFELLSQQVPGVALQGKGLLATEGLFTIPFNCFSDPVPAVLSSLLEFRDADGRCLLMAQLLVGETYDLIVTPLGGFARYAMGDRVVCTGWAMTGVPMLRFVGRGERHSDLVGEKLSEDFVLGCLKRTGVNGILASCAGETPHYKLLVTQGVSDRVIERLELALCENPQYAYARDIAQLGPITQIVAPGFVDKLTAKRLEAGHRLSDIKAPVLLAGSQQFDLLDSEPKR